MSILGTTLKSNLYQRAVEKGAMVLTDGPATRTFIDKANPFRVVTQDIFPDGSYRMEVLNGLRTQKIVQKTNYSWGSIVDSWDAIAQKGKEIRMIFLDGDRGVVQRVFDKKTSREIANFGEARHFKSGQRTTYSIDHYLIPNEQYMK